MPDKNWFTICSTETSKGGSVMDGTMTEHKFYFQSGSILFTIRFLILVSYATDRFYGVGMQSHFLNFMCWKKTVGESSGSIIAEPYIWVVIAMHVINTKVMRLRPKYLLPLCICWCYKLTENVCHRHRFVFAMSTYFKLCACPLCWLLLLFNRFMQSCGSSMICISADCVEEKVKQKVQEKTEAGRVIC